MGRTYPGVSVIYADAGAGKHAMRAAIKLLNMDGGIMHIVKLPLVMRIVLATSVLGKSSAPR